MIKTVLSPTLIGVGITLESVLTLTDVEITLEPVLENVASLTLAGVGLTLVSVMANVVSPTLTGVRVELSVMLTVVSCMATVVEVILSVAIIIVSLTLIDVGVTLSVLNTMGTVGNFSETTSLDTFNSRLVGTVVAIKSVTVASMLTLVGSWEITVNRIIELVDVITSEGSRLGVMTFSENVV